MADFIDLLDDEEDWAAEAPERTKTGRTTEKTKTGRTTEKTTAINAPPLECCICLSELGKTNVTALPCIHCFHTDCIESALKLSSLCPLCKYDSRKHDGDSQAQAQPQPRIRQAILPPVLPPVLPPMGGVMFNFLFGAPVMAPVQHQQAHNAHHDEENGEAAENGEEDDDQHHDHSDHAPRHGAIRRDRHQVRRRLFPSTCQATIAQGPNAGKTCGRKPRLHARFCGYHC
jgi:hypothetical protein